jgi:hypothetical protein
MKFKIILLLALFAAASAGAKLNASIVPLWGETGDIIAIGTLITCIFIPQTMPYTNKYPTTMVCVDNGWFDEAVRQDLYGYETALGWGVEYETAINDTFSFRFREGLVVKNFTNANDTNIYIPAYDFMLDYYFDHQGLHGLNLGFGFGYANSTTTAFNDTQIVSDFDIEYAQLLIGYKFNYGVFMLEPYFDLIVPINATYTSQTLIEPIIAMIGLNIGAAF